MDENFLKEVKERLKLLVSDADYLRNRILRTTNELNKKHKEVELNSFRKIVNYRLFLNLLISDISSSIIFYLNSESKYEKIYSIRMIVVCINEGYKKMYHFTNNKKNGITDLENRNKSFWIKDIKEIIDNEMPEFADEFASITELLDEFWDEKLNDFKIIRNLSIHYDFEMTKVYDEIIKINPDEIFKKLIPFLNIFNKMLDLTLKLTENLLKNIKTKNNEIRNNINKSIENFFESINTSDISEKDEILVYLEEIKRLNDFKF